MQIEYNCHEWLLANQSRRVRCTAGLSLIEAMIAVAVGLLLISILMTLFLSHMQAYRDQFSINRLEANSTAAFNIMNAAVQQAGHIGCARLVRDFPIHAFNPSVMIANTKLRGFNHAFITQYMSLPLATLVRTMDDATTLFIDTNIYFNKGDTAMVADCDGADIFVILHVSKTGNNQKITAASPLSRRYRAGAEIGRWRLDHYFVDKTNRTKKNNQPIYALYVEDLSHRKRELVEGINQLAIKYLILSEDMVLEKAAEDIDDWNKVIGMAVTIQIDFMSDSKILYRLMSMQVW